MPKTVLEPMGDYLLVVDNPRETTIQDIELPSNVRQQEMCFGRVISIGSECHHLAVQDHVCYGPYAGKGVVLGGIEFRLLREGQIEGRLVAVE